MFDIGFSELLLVFVIGLIVLGPERLPVAVKTVVGWIRAIRSLAANVQQELAQELKLQELQDGLKKVEEASKGTLSPELKESIEELRKTAESVKRSYHDAIETERSDDEASHAESVQPDTPPTSETQTVSLQKNSRLITPDQERPLPPVPVEQTTKEPVVLTKDVSPAASEDKS